MDLEAGGQLAALGDRMIRDAMRDLIVQLIANVDRELAAAAPAARRSGPIAEQPQGSAGPETIRLSPTTTTRSSVGFGS